MPQSDCLRIFFDADVLIAGSVSTSGASHVLLRLCELGVIEGVTCAQVIREADENLRKKVPLALPVFRAVITAANIKIVPNPSHDALKDFEGAAHPDDLPMLVAAIIGSCPWLATFNVRHYSAHTAAIKVIKPGDLVARIRRHLMKDLN